MEIISIILFMIVTFIILSIFFKVLWFVLPFLLIGAGIMYIYNQYFAPKEEPVHRRENDDIVDVEFTVRDEEDADQ